MYKDWTVEETKKLEEVYSTSSRDSLLNFFPDRNLSSIHHKAYKLGLKLTLWKRGKVWLTDEQLNLTIAEAAYIAGIVDGEGCINIYIATRTGQVSPQVFITNTDKNMLEIVQIMIKGKGSIRVHCKAGIGEYDGCNRKESYRLWITSMDDIRQFLEAIEPYLITKKFKAQGMLKMIKDRTTDSSLTQEVEDFLNKK